MCLAIPAKIVAIDDTDVASMATVEIMGVSREVALDLTPQAKMGDYVLMHAGFAIEVLDEQSAMETIDIIKELAEITGQQIVIDDADESTAVPALCTAGHGEAGEAE